MSEFGIFDLLDQGFSVDTIIEEYQTLTREIVVKIVEIGKDTQVV